MPDLVRSVEIQAPPDIVWSVWSDLGRWPEWTASITSIEPLSPGPLAVGLRVRVRQPRLPPAEWRVTQMDSGRGFAWVSTAPGVLVTATHLIEPAPGGSHAVLGIAYRGPVARLIGFLTRGLTERYLALEAAGLKRRSEELARRSPGNPLEPA